MGSVAHLGGIIMPWDRCGKEIAGLRFRIGALMVIRECLRLFFAWIMLWAAAVVGLRAVFRIDPFVLLWGGVGLVVAAVVGSLLAMRKVPSAGSLRAVLDRHGRMGGLLMAAGDTDIGQWSQQISQVPMPAVYWQSGRQWMQLTAAIGFLAAALLAPDRYLPSGGETALQLGGQMRQLAEKIQVLKQEEILPPEKAQVLERDLDRLRQDASGRDPAKSLEALDHMEQSFSKAAADAAQSAVQQTETASRAQELAAALDAAKGRMDPKQFSEAMKELAHMAQEAAEEDESLDESLSEELQEALREGSLSDDQLRELCKDLKQCKASQRAKLAKLVEARLVDAAELRMCDKAGQCDEAALACALGQCKDGDELAELMASCEMPGRGGVTRGRGDAKMTWQSKVKKADAAFKEKVLPPAALSSLKKSRLAGVSASDPKSATQGGGSTGGALNSSQAGGGEARTQTILPEHEKTVQRYFGREKK